MLRWGPAGDRAGTQGSLPVGRDVCGPCGQGREQREAAKAPRLGGGEAMERPPGSCPGRRVTAEGREGGR